MTSTVDTSRPTIPLVMLLAALFLFSIQDVLISDLTKRYPVHEIVFIRSLVNIWPLILLSFAFDQGKNMQVTKFWFLFLRGGLLSLSYTCYYLALAGLDFAQAPTAATNAGQEREERLPGIAWLGALAARACASNCVCAAQPDRPARASIQ